MIAHPPRAGRVASALVAALLAVLAWWWLRPHHGDEEGSASHIVQLPAAEQSPTVRAVPRSATPTTADIAPPLPDPRIAATFQDPGATFRNVRSADARNQVVCGEVRLSSASFYRRFVWVAEVQMLATDDGSAQFAGIAKLCDGSAKLRP
ncbi:hypothetical protein [Sphingopyxis sp.]|jgi:hypothetical protein|uniref:hypothetical protein n=1 Tax=Sphingopyxis sp. TaxID=1908224 RepID=UPI002DF16804|nr:hypothetical protein [Sphingopyxis sp.]